MTAQMCSVCGKRLTAWNTAWGTGKCSGCAKGVSPAAKALLRNVTFTRDELTAIAIARRLVLVAFVALGVYFCGLSLAETQWQFYLFAVRVAVGGLWFFWPQWQWPEYLFFAFFGFQAVTIYILAKELKRPNPWNWAAGVALPVLIPIIVLILTLKARAALKQPDASEPTGETKAT